MNSWIPNLLLFSVKPATLIILYCSLSFNYNFTKNYINSLYNKYPSLFLSSSSNLCINPGGELYYSY